MFGYVEIASGGVREGDRVMGGVAGLYPAIRATCLSPTEALRTA